MYLLIFDNLNYILSIIENNITFIVTWHDTFPLLVYSSMDEFIYLFIYCTYQIPWSQHYCQNVFNFFTMRMSGFRLRQACPVHCSILLLLSWQEYWVCGRVFIISSFFLILHYPFSIFFTGSKIFRSIFLSKTKKFSFVTFSYWSYFSAISNYRAWIYSV